MKVLFLPFAKQEGANPYSASSRLRAEWVAKYWDEATYWDGKSNPADWNIIIFQKFYQLDYQRELARNLKELGKFIAFDLCDAEWEHPGRDQALREMIEIADLVTASTWWLSEEIYKRYGKCVHHIPDRQDLSFFSETKRHSQGEHPTIIWYGNRNTLPYVEHYREALTELTKEYPVWMKFIYDVEDSKIEPELANTNLLCIEWTLEGINRQILSGDVVFCPHDLTTDTGRAKSDNKVTNSWALKMPVVSHGTNEQILQQFRRLFDSAELRQEIGEMGRGIVERYYDVQQSVRDWKELLGGVSK